MARRNGSPFAALLMVVLVCLAACGAVADGMAQARSARARACDARAAAARVPARALRGCSSSARCDVRF
jgi:hypothetical protein